MVLEQSSMSAICDHNLVPTGPEEREGGGGSWRWFLVIPAFLVGWFLARWLPIVGTRSDQGEAGYLVVGFMLFGFLPVYLAGRVAPSSRLLIAVESALLVAVWIAMALIFAANNWSEQTYSLAGRAYFLGYNFLALLNAGVAVWRVNRNRTERRETTRKWAFVTALLLPVALLAYVGVESYLS